LTTDLEQGEFIMRALAAVALVVVVAGQAQLAHAQVGKSVTIADANTIGEADLAKLPGLTPALAKTLVAKRPFLSITALDQALTAAGLTREQITTLYGRIFIHINLNAASREEILLIPGVGNRICVSSSSTGRTRRSRSSTARSTSTWTMRSWRVWSNTCSCRSI
jgi:hypothetical protein